MIGDTYGKALARRTVTREWFRHTYQAVRATGGQAALIGFGIAYDVALASYWGHRNNPTVREVLHRRMF